VVKETDPKTNEILTEIQAWVEERKKEGWTRETFCKGLGVILGVQFTPLSPKAIVQQIREYCEAREKEYQEEAESECDPLLAAFPRGRADSFAEVVRVCHTLEAFVSEGEKECR